MKMKEEKNIHNMSQGPPNQGFMQEKVQKEDFQNNPHENRKKGIYFLVGMLQSVKTLILCLFCLLKYRKMTQSVQLQQKYKFILSFL